MRIPGPMGHRWRKSNAQIVERSTRPIFQLVKTRLPMVAPLFRKSNTKQESVPTNVGTSSLVLLETVLWTTDAIY